jgi:hypothetical protein
MWLDVIDNFSNSCSIDSRGNDRLHVGLDVDDSITGPRESGVRE